MSEPATLLTMQFLAWIDRQPRSYAETMDAWRTSCPHMPVWEDALADELVRVDSRPQAAMGGCMVLLTERGRTALSRAEPLR
ncbi:MAG TPA: hypothetical protein VLI93_16875 [Acetobacteraceae bacterium]|nr:hypothetical protein [Acetobacteraceae bacterium]